MEKRRRIEEGYKSALNDMKKKSHLRGPDYEVKYIFTHNAAWFGRLQRNLFEGTFPLRFVARKVQTAS